MALTDDQYVNMIKALFPPGAAWSKDGDLTSHQLSKAFAQELTRVDRRASIDLFNELDPNTASEMLSDWERVVGLPDKVQTSISTDLATRRNDVLRRLTLQGGANASLLIKIASYFGYAVTIEETYPARAGISQAGMSCYGTNWLYCFRVHAPVVISNWAVAGTALAGSPIRTWRNDLLQAVFNQIMPAHTYAVFVYGG